MREKFDDGSYLETHRTRRMCAPMIPFGPTKMDSFNKFYGLGDLDLKDLEFEKACNADSVKSVLGALGQDWARNSLTTAPMGAVLRVAEGIDSIRNLALSGMNVTNEFERGAAIICGISQLGGLIFSIVAIVVTLALCVCAPCGSAIALYIYRSFTMTDEAIAERDRQIDELLRERGAAPSALRLERVRVDRADSEAEPFLPLGGQ